MSSPLASITWPVRTARLTLRAATPDDVEATWGFRRRAGFKRLKAWWARVVQRAPNLFAHWRWTKEFQLAGW